MFRHVEPYPGDPILGLVETFRDDDRAEKVNLGIGIYYDNQGKMPVSAAVRTAETVLTAQPQPCPYLPMEGSAVFRYAVEKLLFGAESAVLKEKRAATVQTLGGSGALKIGADFLRRWFPDAKVYLSDPTWDNHRSIFEGAGFEVGAYPYYDPVAQAVKFDEMLSFFNTLPKNSILVLHPCCHNPTGADLTFEQWDALLDTVGKRGLIPFMDMAYQGFGGSFDEDAYALRKATELGLTLFASNSFSKNMGLYGHRVGVLSVVCPSSEEAALVFGQCKAGVRRIYSSPPVYGAALAAAVLTTPELQTQWEAEVYAMRDRIRAMRLKLCEALRMKQLPEQQFAHIGKQRGMFSYTGLSPQQVVRLREEYAVYLVESGRMCVAGLNESNIGYTADAFAAVWQTS